MLSLIDDVSPCQHFLVRFYGLHVRLLLNSCSLQDLPNQCKDGISPSKQALWLCFTSAVGMLELISQEFGPLKLLYFAQDSVHVMTAYAATFLIKVYSLRKRSVDEVLTVKPVATLHTRLSSSGSRGSGYQLHPRSLGNIQRSMCSSKDRMCYASTLSITSSRQLPDHESPVHNAQLSPQQRYGTRFPLGELGCRLVHD